MDATCQSTELPAREIQAWSGNADRASRKPPSFLTADAGIPCRPPFARGLRFTGSTAKENRLELVLSLSPRRPASPGDAGPLSVWFDPAR